MQNEKTTVPDDMSKFIGLSAVLTGFSRDILSPGFDVVDIKSTYINVWREKTDATDKELSDNILSKYESLDSKKLPDQNIGEQMLDENNGKDFVLACRNLIFLWYMGSWPTLIDNGDEETKGMVASSVLSSDSYTSGLVWQVMQSHPMGDSNDRYGYWSKEPANLSDYTGNLAVNKGYKG